MCLAALKANFTLTDLEDAIKQFDTELKVFGPDLQDLTQNKGKVGIPVFRYHLHAILRLGSLAAVVASVVSEQVPFCCLHAWVKAQAAQSSTSTFEYSRSSCTQSHYSTQLHYHRH